MFERNATQALHADCDRALAPALAELERALLTPLISGELSTWVENMLQAFDEAEPVIRAQIGIVHLSELEQIQSEDPELAARVEKLAQADQGILEETARFREVAEKLVSATPAAEPSEKPAASVIERLSQRGEALIVSIRRQEESLKAWRHEALARDRGNVD